MRLESSLLVYCISMISMLGSVVLPCTLQFCGGGTFSNAKVTHFEILNSSYHGHQPVKVPDLFVLVTRSEREGWTPWDLNFVQRLQLQERQGISGSAVSVPGFLLRVCGTSIKFAKVSTESAFPKDQIVGYGEPRDENLDGF